MSAIVSAAIGMLVAGLFAASAWSKLNPANRAYYTGVMAGYGIEDAAIAMRCTVAVGAIESVIAFLVVIPLFRSAGLLVAAAILASYFSLMTLQLLRGKAGMDCGCAGPAHPTGIGAPVLMRNAVLLLLTAWASQIAPPSMAAGWLLAAALGVFLWLCAMSAEQLIGNRQRLQNLRGPRALARH